MITIDEVILVGGASRVPAIREMLREHQQKMDQKNSTSATTPAVTTPGTIKASVIKDAFPSADDDSNSTNYHQSNNKSSISYTFLNDLCLSVHPMSAVAQGCAVHAALLSHTIPLHEIRSALMLDTCPYSIGVLIRYNNNDEHNEHQESSSYVEIISKDSTLPAANYATFQLADANQRGVTITAVEMIEEDDDEDHNRKTSYNVMGEFTFLLHRLTSQQIATMLPNNIRSIDVGMTLKEDGQFIVSIFDINDPEHVTKRSRFIQEKKKNMESIDLKLPYDDVTAVVDEPFTREQIVLMIVCIVIFILYVVVKISFASFSDDLVSEATAIRTMTTDESSGPVYDLTNNYDYGSEKPEL